MSRILLMFREGKVPGPADLAYEPLIDIVQELREEAHIDHMFPIARGGCNDLVNLQLLCSKCNLTKRDEDAEAMNSVPRYIRRGKGRGATSAP